MVELGLGRDDVIGIISERDYLTKVALLGKQSRTTPVSAICTQGESNLITVSYDETVDECMRKVRVVWAGPHRPLHIDPPPPALAHTNAPRCWRQTSATCSSRTTPARSCRSSPSRTYASASSPRSVRPPTRMAPSCLLPRVFLTPPAVSPVATCFLPHATL
jgi:hypothetical protein